MFNAGIDVGSAIGRKERGKCIHETRFDLCLTVPVEIFAWMASN